jgi:serine/threonine protein kinase
MLAKDTLLQNRYRVARLIAEGGMGAVYEATDERLGHTVALKETFFTDDLRRKAFEREARLLANLRHAALPRVSDHFVEESRQFLVMEYIPGQDLAELLERQQKPFSPGKVLGWADQLLQVLTYLHAQQPPIIHRDIKPRNLKVSPDGQIILLDFGLAKGVPLDTSRVTTIDSLYGYTPHYAPPEQMNGSGTDARTDLYSLAATLYHLMTGVPPPLERAMTILEGKPDPLRPAHELNPNVTPAVAAVLQQAMAPSRAQRPASAADMRRALREASRPWTGVGHDQTTLVERPSGHFDMRNPTGSGVPADIAETFAEPEPPPPTRWASPELPEKESISLPAPAVADRRRFGRSNALAKWVIGAVLGLLVITLLIDQWPDEKPNPPPPTVSTTINAWIEAQAGEEWKPFSDRTTFKNSQRFRIGFTTSRAGNYYVLMRSAEGGFEYLFPNKYEGRTTAWVKENEVITIPPPSAQWSFAFDEKKAGEERLFIIHAPGADSVPILNSIQKVSEKSPYFFIVDKVDEPVIRAFLDRVQITGQRIEPSDAVAPQERVEFKTDYPEGQVVPSVVQMVFTHK